MTRRVPALSRPAVDALSKYVDHIRCILPSGALRASEGEGEGVSVGVDVGGRFKLALSTTSDHVSAYNVDRSLIRI